MSISTKLNAILAPVFSNELYPVIHPDPDGKDTEVAKLYAIFAAVGGQVTKTLESTDDLRRPRMQITIYGIDFDNVDAKKTAVIAAMDTANSAGSQAVDDGEDPLTKTGSLPNIMVGEPIDGYEKGTKRYKKILEFYCWTNT